MLDTFGLFVNRNLLTVLQNDLILYKYVYYIVFLSIFSLNKINDNVFYYQNLIEKDY